MKKILSLVLAAVLCLSVISVSAEEAPFTDVSASKWYYQAVLYCQQKGLMSGVGGGKFCPNDNSTREMAVNIIYALAGSPAVTSASPFADVPAGKWYTNAICWSAEHQIVSGVSATRFGLGQLVTREQMAAFFCRYAEFVGKPTEAENNISAFPDAKDVSSWAKDAMNWALEIGIISGRTNHSVTMLCPKETLTRAELAMMLMNFCEYLEKQVPPELPELLEYQKYDLAAYTAPIFSGSVVYQESALVMQNADGTFRPVSLLYPIDQIVSVRSSALDREFTQGTDYEVTADGKLQFKPGADIPYLTDSTLYSRSYISGGAIETKDGGYTFSVQGKVFHKLQIAVTYTHSETEPYDGFVQPYKGELLPKTERKLQNNEPLKITFLGDSITNGLNVSGIVNTAPFMPTWAQMTSEALRDIYGKNVSYQNFGIGGTTASWGIDQVNGSIIPSKPDLLVLAFGMNDGAGDAALSAADFVGKLQTIISKVKNACPDCEFLLVSTMLPNPDSSYADKTQSTYEQAMMALEQEGIAVVQMTSVHKGLLERKSYQDMTGDNLVHPNDFLSRCYAQSVLAALLENPCGAEPTGEENKGSSVTYSTEIPARPIPEQPAALQVLVNEKTWINRDISEYAGQNSAWVEIPLDISDLREGVNQFTVTSTVRSEGNLTDKSVDVFFSKCDVSSDTFVSTNDMVYWTVFWTAYLNAKLELFDGQTWVSADSRDYAGGGGSTVLGLFVPDGNEYMLGRNINVTSLEGYQAARLMLNVHVGKNVCEKNPTEETAAKLLVGLNHTDTETFDLTAVRGRNSVWVTVPLDFSALKEGQNSVSVDSNVTNTGNLTGTSLDLYFTASSTVRDTQLSQDLMQSWVNYTDRYANIYLELREKGTDNWVSIGKDTFSEDMSTVIGMFTNEYFSGPFNMQRLFNVSGKDNYDAVRAVIQLHVGLSVNGD